MSEEKGLISVIMPAFNAEKTIAVSIESVQRQTYQKWELIIVDDGSTDATRTICQEYVLNDDRIFYIKQDNSGVSSARNLGIQYAKGEYISFCDSDDYFEADALNILIQIAIINDADYLIPRSRGVYYTPEGVFERNVLHKDDFDIIIKEFGNGREFERLRSSYSIYSTCGRLYRREFLEKWKINFNSEVKILEDFCFNLKCLQKSNVTVHKSYIAYNYTVYGIENYKFRRNYKIYVDSLPHVYRELMNFHNNKKLKVEKTEVDFLMGYWIFALEGILTSNDNLSQRIKSVKKILDEVMVEKLYDNCTKEYLDTHFKVLFGRKSVVLFFIIYYLKQFKHRIKFKFT